MKELEETVIAAGIYTGPVYWEGWPEQFLELANAIEAKAAAKEREACVRKPLTSAEMAAGREAIFSTGNPYCPCDAKTFRKVAEWVERHHGITEATDGKPGEVPHG